MKGHVVLDHVYFVYEQDKVFLKDINLYARPGQKIAFVGSTGPYGNKSLGEPPAIPVAPAIRNAILNATGVHMNVTPMTAQRLIEKFKEKGLI